jgi:hypothetical protein
VSYYEIAREHGPEKWNRFSDILDIGYFPVFHKDMLQLCDVEPIYPDRVDPALVT